MTETPASTEPAEPLAATQDSEVDPPTGEPATGTEAHSDVFTREYVTSLRDESARHRVKASTAATRLVQAYAAATGRLVDPSDLAASDDLLGEDGLPSAEKVADAVAALIALKPHLAKIRPMGSVGQGSSPDATSDAAGAFASLLRGVAS